ncbi:MAG TPA: AAA family ATPase, partial [Polyangiales bacterium]
MSTPTLIAGRYRVESLLGRGGMGAVYAVYDEASGERFALKRLLSHASERMTRLFELEYQTLASLCHPGIVRVFDYQRDAEGMFYTMEHVQGRDLSDQAPLPWREACACLRDVATILALLHARRVVHRDLTPRNLLRMDNGRLKLIDFGSLAAFGETDDVVGTLQFMAPESLGDRPLDQRADLFSLGALGYWLLTGVHAFPARNISELEQSWQRTPAPPSSLSSLVDGLEPPPQALDDLIANLLQIDPAARPTNTAELIDRLTSLADLEPEAYEQSAQGYLASKAFVGRVQERERVRAAFTPAKRGQGRAILFEGESGTGHSRLLQEIGVMARLQGALVGEANASAGTQSYGAALELLFGLLPALNRQAEELRLLARLSPELHARIGGGALPEVEPSEARVRYQNAFHALILNASHERLMVLLLDDLHAMDEESQALFAALAHSAGSEPLVLVGAARRDAFNEPPPALSSYRQVALRMRLLPLNATDTLELLRSLFGSVPYLERVSEHLYRASEGNPGHCLALASLLVDNGTARYRDGMWVLPTDLSAQDLPRERKLVWRERVERMPHAARTLATFLSVQPRDALTLPQCLRLGALSGLSDVRTRDLLAVLVREGLLVDSTYGYRFAHEEIAKAMYAELTDVQKMRAHRTFGELLLAQAGDDPLGRLRACPHFLRAGDRAIGEDLALSMARAETVDYPSMVRSSAPICEEILAVLKSSGANDYVLLEPLAILAAASYFSDRRYATRYGEEALALLTRVMRVELARRLSKFIGKRAALFVTLAMTAIALFIHRKHTPSMRIVLMRTMGAAASLAATSATCLDPEQADRYTAVIEPLAALGRQHVCGVGYATNEVAALQVRDYPAKTVAFLEEFIAQLESPEPIAYLPSAHRQTVTAGCYFALGVTLSFRESPRALEIADKLERFGPLWAMQADYIRATHYNGLGDLTRATHYRQRAEVHAVHLGTAWQVDTWAPADATKVGLRAFDVLTMKQSTHELARFAREIPALAREERRARGVYLALRGRNREALALLDVDEVPLAHFGWGRTRGVLAMVCNALGDHQRALAVCEDALSRMGPEDLEFTVLNLGLQIELSMSKLGLGRID